MTFLHAWAIWIGAAAVALPVAVHLLTRPRPVRMSLSTIRFVREAIRQRRARHRLRDLLVLSLRMLAVLLLALAVARPQWGEKPLVADRQPGSTVRVVILDVSQSMAAMEHGIEAIERARTIAADFLGYNPAVEANLILAAASPRPVFDEPSTNFEALRQELAQSQALPERLDVNRALEMAGKMLAPQSEDDHRRRELVVVSDFQRANWARADFAPLPEATQIQMESTAPVHTPPNLAVLAATCHARRSDQGTGRMEIELGNFSPATERVEVEVALGKATWRWQATCPARRRTTLSEEIELKQGGWQWGHARLSDVDDALAADNVRPLVVQIREQPVYVLLTRERSDRRPTSSHFLECALAPDAAAGQAASTTLLRLDPLQFDTRAVASADLIVLDHPGNLSQEAIQLLAGMLRRGKPMLYVAGQTIDATNLQRLSEAVGGGLRLPVQFLPPPVGRNRRNLTLASVARSGGPFGVFGDQLGGLVDRLRFGGGLSSQPVEGGLKDEVLATYIDGSACLVVNSSEAGSVAVLNADLMESNLPRTPAFVPLLSELVEQLLTHNPSQPAAICGEPLVAHLPSEVETAAGLQIVGPEGAATPPGNLTDSSLSVTWQWPSPNRSGVYRAERDANAVYALPIGIAPEESDLESLPGGVIRDKLAAGRALYYHSAAGEAQQRDDFWKWCAVACIVCVLAELATLLAFKS